MPFLSGFIFSGFSEMSQSLHFRRATWKEVPCLIVFCGLVWTVLPQLPTSPHEKEDHAESLYQDLTRFLREGDYVSLPQAMETELDYWHRVRGATVPFLRFFISGDWHYSVYRLDSDDHKVLRRPLLGSSFYILETKDGDVASGQALFKKLLQTDKLQLEELSVTTKRAKIWKVSQGKKDASEN
jgi:hypothetical protein